MFIRISGLKENLYFSASLLTVDHSATLESSIYSICKEDANVSDLAPRDYLVELTRKRFCS